MLDNYAVFGNPVEHSKSPDIHAAFSVATGENISYKKQTVEIDCFAKAADIFFSSGGKGLNITVPFKLDAYDYAGRLTARARHAGAVNTLSMQSDGTILGDTTDGAGTTGKTGKTGTTDGAATDNADEGGDEADDVTDGFHLPLHPRHLGLQLLALQPHNPLDAPHLLIHRRRRVRCH